MPTYEASAVSRAHPGAVWDVWIDVARWSESEHIESARIDGEFRPGAAITSKARGLPRSTLKVTRVEPPALWVDESRSPGGPLLRRKLEALFAASVAHVARTAEPPRP